MQRSTKLITTVNQPIIENKYSYWAQFFESVLATLNYHKTFRYNTNNFNYLWSLKDLKGSYPNNFFYYQQRQMKNWGMQYLLQNLLNHHFPENVINNLVANIEYLNNSCLNITDLSKYKFHVVGQDSSISQELYNGKTYYYPL